MESTCVAIIPARGGSKRLPGKNIRPFLGIPLINYSINYAKARKAIDYIVVSTDDAAIKAISLKAGAHVIDRPVSISGDTDSTASALQHILVELAKQNLHFDYAATLQVTNPLRPDSLFDQCYSMIKNSPEADSVISVSRSGMKLGKLVDGFFKPENYTPGQRSQDLGPQYFENGLIYISKSSNLIKSQELFGDKVLACEVAEDFPIVDIDNEIDFLWGEFLLKTNKEQLKHLL